MVITMLFLLTDLTVRECNTLKSRQVATSDAALNPTNYNSTNIANVSSHRDLPIDLGIRNS